MQTTCSFTSGSCCGIQSRSCALYVSSSSCCRAHRGTEGNIYKFSASTGALQWTSPAEGAFYSQGMFLRDACTLVVNTYQHGTYAVDTVNGSLKWRAEDIGSGGSTPTLTRYQIESVYQGGSNGVVVLSANAGAVLGTCDSGSTITSVVTSSTIDGEKMYVSGSDGVVRTIRISCCFRNSQMFICPGNLSPLCYRVYRSCVGQCQEWQRPPSPLPQLLILSRAQSPPKRHQR